MRKFPLCAVALAGALACSGAWAVQAPPTDIHLSYSFTSSIPQGEQQIYDIATYNSYENNDSGVWWSAWSDASGGTIGDLFAKSSANKPLTGLLLGLLGPMPQAAAMASPLVSAAGPRVVLMLDSSAASAAEGKAWRQTFNNAPSEGDLISAVQFAMEHDRDKLDDDGKAQWDAAFGLMGSFVNDNPQLAFALPAPVAGQTTTSSFTVMAWSNGEILGTGTASVTQVPEVSTYLMMALGLGVLGLARRRAGRA